MIKLLKIVYQFLGFTKFNSNQLALICLGSTRFDLVDD